MRNLMGLVILLAIVSLFARSSDSLAQQREAREGITYGNQKYMVAFERGDGAGAAEIYTENASILPPNSESVNGRAAIQAFWQGVMDAGVTSVKLETREVENHGDTAHEVGTYLLGSGEDQVIDKGKYVVIWKHEAGQWKINRGIWNSSRAQQQGAAQPGAMVLSYNKCSYETMPQFMEFLQADFIPVLDLMVQENKLIGYGFLDHAWGDEWNVVIFYQAADREAFFNAWGEMLQRVSQRDPQYLQTFGSYCSEHKDNIYGVALMKTAANSE